MHVWQADLVKDEITEHIPQEGCDLLLIMFVLSAVNPRNMDLFMEHALRVFVLGIPYIGIKTRWRSHVPRLWTI